MNSRSVSILSGTLTCTLDNVIVVSGTLACTLDIVIVADIIDDSSGILLLYPGVGLSHY